MSNDCDFQRFYDEEYETQHFGFSSTEFIIQFSSTICETIESVHKDVQECIAVKLKLEDKDKEQLQKEMHQLSKLYFRKSEALLKKFETDGRIFFAIPKNVLLETDSIHDVHEIDISKIVEEINTLEKECLKEKTLVALYKEEIEFIKQFDKYQKPLENVLKDTAKILDPQYAETKKLLKKTDKLYRRLQSSVNSDNFVSQYNNVCHRNKFVTRKDLEPLE